MPNASVQNSSSIECSTKKVNSNNQHILVGEPFGEKENFEEKITKSGQSV